MSDLAFTTELTSWRAEIERMLGPFLTGFEDSLGYPPGDNHIREPDLHVVGSPRLRELPPALAAFYQVIGEVVLPDIGNGHFVHAAEDVLDQLREEGAVDVCDGVGAVVFASNGGGVLYAIDSTGAILRSHAASRDSAFEPVATDLADYLHQLLGVVAEFVRTGDPGKL
ncbi:hypothetical protein D0T12_28020 [Actinomadura spongiicola]|uniref:SMI1/KNR4 family protein n=1 Tax=Actinomadura spongiicola TaxID=2303421 RepID=A0A372G9N3_9ACTN|nr:hypothetical protein [Actinomadura spongiicola]RFS82098.1 hypothetical protein D0T12_28020 [Actinomadura spongiicola]